MTSDFYRGVAAVVTVFMWGLVGFTFISWINGFRFGHPLMPLIASGWFFGRMIEKRIHTGSWT